MHKGGHIMRKILIGTFLAIAAIFITAGSGFDSTGNKPISGLNAPKAQAEDMDRHQRCLRFRKRCYL